MNLFVFEININGVELVVVADGFFFCAKSLLNFAYNKWHPAGGEQASRAPSPDSLTVAEHPSSVEKAHDDLSRWNMPVTALGQARHRALQAEHPV